MIDLTFTKEQMLQDIDASHRAFVNRFSDPLSPDLLSLDEASLVIRGTTPGELSPVLNVVLSKRFAHVPPEQLFSDLMYPVKKGLGNAHKWGNKRDSTKNITIEVVLTKRGAVVSISDEGEGFDAEGILSKVHRLEPYFTHGGSGFHHFAKAQSLISYADGARTLLIRYRCTPDVSAAGLDVSGIATETRLATAMKLARARVCLVSYPMSGDLWLRALIGKALCEKYGLDERLIFREPRLTRTAGVLRTVCGADLLESTHYQDLDADLSRYRFKRVILLIRDPRDLVVSCYFCVSRPKGAYQGSLSDFVRSDHHGIRKIVTFYKIWHANRHVPEMFLPIRYEDLHSDPGGTLRRALAMIDAQEYADEIINRAVDYGNCHYSRKMEGARPADGATMKPGDDKDREWYQGARARVGAYMDYLNQEDQEYVNGVIEMLGEPLFITPGGPPSRDRLFSKNAEV
jgi:hypothetical protein